ncbi:glutamate--tRNA ligase [Plasmodium gaboni]|uniref:glutamate--tRNA ligase n=1 Tax=Plasmodium gaboni TaxID=647221 RepID=A0ABY1UST4_9APIC|nr:glutamate--tRNA ligase [Plasmodium gaboni]
MKYIFLFLVNLIIINLNIIVPKYLFGYSYYGNPKCPINTPYDKKYICSFILNNNKRNSYNSRIKCIKNNSIIPNDVAEGKVRLRFAPSPTGFLHVGGCRTFLYNYILSKQMNGSLILRLEDTDIKRNTKNSLDEIIKDLKWLNLTWDEGPDKVGEYGPYKQSEKIELYKKIAHQFVNEGKAYFCFCSKEELQEIKEKSKMIKKKYIYNRKCRDMNSEEIKKKLEQNITYTIRFKSPLKRKIILKDILKGDIIDEVLEDFIILRSNELPTYNFSVSVDDYLMRITHVIRGVEHISNTFKQILILETLNADIPNYAHIPVITTEEKKKISKRNNEYLIRNLREEGFKPECVVNYMTTLGWGSISKKEFYTMNELIDTFNIHKLNKSSVVFDIKKLKWMNKKYMLEQDNDTYVQEAEQYMINNNILSSNKYKEFVELCVDIFKYEVHNYYELKECILNALKYEHQGNDYLNNDDIYLKQVAFLLYDWYLKNEVKDNNEYIEMKMINDFDTLIDDIVKSTNLKKNQVLLKIRLLLTFQRKGIPFIYLIKLWASARKHNIPNYFSLEKRFLHLKNVFNF